MDPCADALPRRRKDLIHRRYLERTMARILAVDDSRSMRDMVSFTLKSAGHDVTQACDGEEALQIAQTASFDLVLTDVNMPNRNGISLVEELRRLATYGTTPMLLLTTESSQERKNEGIKAGATGWIVKPFSPESLLATISKVLG